jgi:RNA polymerase sigma-70 factor, ECF subfamily
MMGAIDPAAIFEAERPRLLGLAYRLLGTRSDAEDIVQEAWLRFSAVDPASIESPAAWLTTVTSRVGIDRLRQRRRERVSYVGPWLPEPLIEPFDSGERERRRGPIDTTDTHPRSQPASSAELSDSLTTAFLVLLEALSPEERLVVLLVDVFKEPFTSVAATLCKSETACRQIASRARRKLHCDEHEAGVLRRSAHDDKAAQLRVAWQFSLAVRSGDVAAVLALAAPDIVLVSDGGANRHAARRPVVGPDKVSRFLVNLARRMPIGAAIEPVWMNGVPAFLVLVDAEPVVLQAIEVTNGKVCGISTIVNPDKLARVREHANLV